MIIESGKIASPWFANVCRRNGAALKLFCFPYAGGNTATFHNWHQDLPTRVEIYPVQLPGRGLRLREGLFTRMDALISEMMQALRPFLNCDFAFFGHSMGALIAFELARALRAHHDLEPKCLFVAGRRAPQMPDEIAGAYALPDDEFIVRLQNLNGTPGEVLNNPEMLEFVLPIIRADFELVQTYTYREGPRLSCPIKAFGGLGDEYVTKSSLLAWRDYTTGLFSLSMIPGGHFFFQQSRKQFMSALSADLRSAAATLRVASISA